MMSRWCDQSIPDERHSAFSSGPLEVAVLFGTLVAETILASVHVRAHKQAGHMDASDLIKHCKTPCKEGVVHIWKINRLNRERYGVSRQVTLLRNNHDVCHQPIILTSKVVLYPARVRNSPIGVIDHTEE